MNPTKSQWKIRVVIPALNEEHSIGKVISALPQDWVTSVHVADNGSNDKTAAIAREHGARVVLEENRGYGSACMAALEDLRGVVKSVDHEIVVFLDADYSDDPSCLPQLIEPLINQTADLVLGNRNHSGIDPRALTPQQHWGNRLATSLIFMLHKVRYRDLGPFRALRLETLEQLEMSDPDFGWTVEMQLKAARRRLRTFEVDLPYRRRIGRSKISGTIRGSVRAGIKILSLIFLDLIAGSRNREQSGAN